MSHSTLPSRHESWELDPQHSLVEFSVRHMMISSVRGRFSRVSGIVLMEPADASSASIDVTIDAASIDSGIASRDDHLRSPDFLDVEEFPSITFHATHVHVLRPRKYHVKGDLTIRGVTREVALWVESGGIVKDPWGMERAGFSATATISRREFGLTWNAALETGGVAVADEVSITIEVELLRQSGQRAA